MLSTLAPARRRLVLGILGLVGVLVVALVGVVVVRQVVGTSVADQADPGPVVLVPGYGGDVGSLTPLARELRSEGRTTVVFTPTANGTGDLRTSAERLSTLVEKTLASNDATSVDLVAYSAGGVISRLYVRDDGGASVVRRVVTIGSPHHGTDVAQIAEDVAGGCPTACEQLATDSSLIQRLNAGDETPDGPRWITLRSTSDRTVTPTDSASLQGGLDIEVQDVCPGSTTSHGDLPEDPVVLATLRSALGTGAPQRPTKVSC